MDNKGKILIVDDDQTTRYMLQTILQDAGYICKSVENGTKGIEAATIVDAPKIIIMDWMMPDIDGIEAIKLIKKKQARKQEYSYIIMLTSRSDVRDLVYALDNGADDFVNKPFNSQELLARIKVGFKFFELKKKITDNIKELQEHHSEIYKLQDLLPVCCKCHKIKNPDGYWEKFEKYLQLHGITFSHGLCNECYNKELQELNIDEYEHELLDLNYKIHSLHENMDGIGNNIHEIHDGLENISDMSQELSALVKNKFKDKCKNCKTMSECDKCY